MIDRYSLIIFDWDGTVVDSVPNIVKALKYAAECEALPQLEGSAYRSVIGLSLQKAFLTLYPDVASDVIERLVVAYRQRHRALEAQASRPFQGAVEGLALIKDSGTFMGVATGKSRLGLERSFQANGFNGYFDASVTVDEAASKPNPEMLQRVMTALSVTADNVLMVGDSVHDMAMAANAGVDRLAVTYGAQKAEQLKVYEPVCVADHFDEITDWLDLNP